MCLIDLFIDFVIELGFEFSIDFGFDFLGGSCRGCWEIPLLPQSDTVMSRGLLLPKPMYIAQLLLRGVGQDTLPNQ